MNICSSKILFFLLLVLITAFLGSLVPVSAQSSPELLVELRVDDNSFSSSEAVVVRVVITNPTDEDFRVLSWYTPANGILEPLFTVTRDGVPANYLGALYKRPDPTEQDYIIIAAGESLEYVVDLSQYYSFAQSGDYIITYATSSENLYNLNISGTLISNPIPLYVIGRTSPLKKVIQPQVVSGNTTFNACSAPQQTALVIARNDASTYANTAKNYFNNNRAGALYQLWFGVFNASRYALPKSHFNLISTATDTATVNFDCTCTDSFYAYVYPSSPYNIYLCSYFWVAPATGTDSKAGTLIHEMSHFTVLGGTDDYIYGQTGAKSLAISNPAYAVMNADNHEYFAENTPVTSDNAPAYTLSETSLNFGSQPSGTTSAAHTFTLTNRGDVNLSIGLLSVSSQFNLLSDNCSNNAIVAGGTCTFDIAFAPTSTGSKIGTATIPSNATIATSVSLNGIGTAAITQTISGSTGVSRVVLSYTDGTSKSVTTDGNGNYSLIVPNGWSGTITPSHACYTFNPASYSYTNVTAAQPNQNYTATFVPTNGCAIIGATIGGVNQGTYTLAPGESSRVNYPTVDAGPVKIESTNGVPIIAALREAWNNQQTGLLSSTSFAQLMGIPAEQLSDTYYLPHYNDLSPLLDAQLRIGNVDTTTATVAITIGGVLQETVNIAPGASYRVNYPTLDAGPVKVESTDNKKIVVALREAWNNQQTGLLASTSFTQLMGIPAEQLSDTYYLPHYNDLSPLLDAQLRIGNVDTTTATVAITIGGVLQETVNIAPGASYRVNYPTLDAGPVKVESTDNKKIVVALREAWNNQQTGLLASTSFAQVMGIPAEKLSDTYLLPHYNDLSPLLDAQLRIGNVDTTTATVAITIGGVLQETVNIAPGASYRVNYPTLDAGPVKVESTDNKKIVVALREAWNNQGTGLLSSTSFTQLMGLPLEDLSVIYYLPHYNDLSPLLDAQLRFGVP
jgi:peptidyl-Lys metalloendopeptidase